ncbi:MAG: HAD hydrolase-like protein [Candidatus Carbobacillus altaicus]|nr:HAD hydrolase-like protein [Candidatus Carbobacillus altaicus]
MRETLIRKAALFDMDGTLFDAWPLALKAYEMTYDRLRKEGYEPPPLPPEDILKAQLGKTYDAMWGTLIPGRSLSFYELADRWMFEYEEALLKRGYGALFPDVIPVLETLVSRGFYLFVASNGRESYIQMIVERFGLKHYFKDLYSAGRFGTRSKVDLVRRLITTYPAPLQVMIGDRRSDVEAGVANDLYVVGCLYGYGSPEELKEADTLITSLPELLDLPLLR